VRCWTSVRRIWLPEASRCVVGWVSCTQLCLSAYRPDGCCICRSPTQLSPGSVYLRLVWSYSPPRFTLVLSLCLSCGPLVLNFLGCVCSHFWGCQYVPGPCGSLFRSRLCNVSLPSGFATWLALPWPRCQVLHLSNGRLHVAGNRYLRHSVRL
jgi:hypothetical protein